MKTLLFAALSVTLFLTGCSKGSSDNPQATCTAVAGIRATASANTIEKGQTLSFQAPVLSNVTYNWTIPGGSSVITTATGSVSNINFSNEGWYYLTVTNTCNETKKDSFYVDVTMPQGAATCTPAANSITYTAAGHQNGTFTTIQQGEPGINRYEFFASGSISGDLTIFFSPFYKNNNQPQDGVYTTGTFGATGFPVFSTSDLDKVFIVVATTLPASIIYKSVPGNKVYITRTGGKMKVVICDMPMAGSSNGTPYSTNITVSATEQ